MLQYLLTGLAGIALGIAIYRVWQSRTVTAPVEAAPAPAARIEIGARKLLIGAGVLVAAALVLFWLKPEGEAATGSPATVPADAAAPGGADKVGDVDTMIQRLADRLAKTPGDGEGFRMLGWSYVMTGHPDKAIEPYKRALRLLPGNAVVHTGYGEALAGIAGGKVTDEARAEFDKALAIDPREPRARYFTALWQAQNGHERQALDAWISLANSGPADAPWQADVRRQITETAKKLDVDVSSRLKAQPAVRSAGTSISPVDSVPMLDPAQISAAKAMSDGDRQNMINGMVDRLASQLKANPKDAEGWVRLMRSRMVLQQPDVAASDLATARKALAGDAAGLDKVGSAARQLGVPGA
ncbi:MAG: hypothetical protein KGL48_04885 [Sphingomonadales bacterium]|nr:hypothetical protein [Sphingomonadales bacterium]MDE2568743.1 hypothetical protein [Sphingomonadales bacterium]